MTAPTDPGAPPPDPDDRFAAGGLASRAARLDARYWRLWGAVSASNLGDGMVALALPWLASLLTRDALAIAGVALATRLPWLVFSLPAGVLGDRFDRRRLMVGANGLRAVIAGGAAIAVALDAMTLPLVYLAAFALGMCEVVFDNTSQTLLPALVPRQRLERANGTLMGAQMVVNDFLAPPLAGALVGLAVAIPFGLDAATAALSAGLVAAIPGRFRARTSAAPSARTPMRREVTEGMRWLWRHPLLRRFALALAVMNGVAAGALATYVLFVQEILRLDGVGYGLLLAAGSVGGLLGSVTAPTLTARIGPGRSLALTVAVPVVTFSVTAVTSEPTVVAIGFAATAYTSVVWNVVTVSLRQTLIPDHLLGRVNSVYRFFGWGAMPVGTLLGGGVVRLVEAVLGRPAGLRAPFAVAAAVHLVLLLSVSPKLTGAAIAGAHADAVRPPAEG